MTDAICKGCGKRIYWAQTADGSRIPLDAVAPVYLVTNVAQGAQPDELKEQLKVRELMCERSKAAFVSHFVTCPQRSQFSKR